MKKPVDVIEWINYEKGKTKIKTDEKGFAHVLAFTGFSVFPCVYRSGFDTFTCGSIYIQHVKMFAYMPLIRTPKGVDASRREAHHRWNRENQKEAIAKYLSNK